MKPKKHFYYGLNVSLNIKYLAKSQSMIKNSFLSRLATNGLQAGTVCSLKLFLPKCLFKDTNVCCFCKNEKLVCRNFLQKLLPRLRKLCLLAVS